MVKKILVKFYMVSGLVVFFLLIAIEILSVNNTNFGKLGTYLWFSSYFFLVTFFFYCLTKLFSALIKGKTILTSLTIIATVVVLFLNIPLLKNISGETTQEIACTLNLLSTNQDKGFRQTCLFGYPVRQFFLPAIPSFFGRNIYNLNLGGSLYFIIGIIVFSAGVLEFLDYTFLADLLCAIFLSCLPHLHFFNVYLFAFEQSIFPFCFALITTGVFLMYLKKNRSFLLPLFGFLLLFLIFSYTPSLSLYFLALTIITYLVIKGNNQKTQKIILVLICITTLVAFYFSLKFRSDIKVFSFKERSQSTLAQDVLSTVEHLFFQNGVQNFVSPIFNAFFLGAIIIPLFFVFGWKAAFISGWAAVTIFISIISQGYNYCALDQRLERAVLIFPVIFGLFAILSKKINDEGKKCHSLLIPILILLAISGFFYQRQYLKNRNAHINSHFIFRQLEVFLEKGGIKKNKKDLYLIGETKDTLCSLHDQLQYFYPYLNIIYNPQNTQINIDTCTFQGEGIYIINQNHQCYLYLKNEGGFLPEQLNVLGMQTRPNQEALPLELSNLAIIDKSN